MLTLPPRLTALAPGGVISACYSALQLFIGEFSLTSDLPWGQNYTLSGGDWTCS